MNEPGGVLNQLAHPAGRPGPAVLVVGEDYSLPGAVPGREIDHREQVFHL